MFNERWSSLDREAEALSRLFRVGVRRPGSGDLDLSLPGERRVGVELRYFKGPEIDPGECRVDARLFLHPYARFPGLFVAEWEGDSAPLQVLASPERKAVQRFVRYLWLVGEFPYGSSERPPVGLYGGMIPDQLNVLFHHGGEHVRSLVSHRGGLTVTAWGEQGRDAMGQARMAGLECKTRAGEPFLYYSMGGEA